MNDSSNKIKQIRDLKSGNGIQHLLYHGYKILGNPIYIHDIDYKIIAHTENSVTDDSLWNELISTGIHGKESIEFFKQEDFIDAVANARTITFLTSNKLKYDRLLGKIRNKDNIMVACMDVVFCNKPFESDDAQAFEVLCDIISKEMSRNDFYQIYGEQHQEKVICDLLSGSVHDKRLYSRRVGSLYEGLKNNIYIAAVDISKYNFEHAYSVYFKNLLKEAERTFKYAIYEDYIAFIFSSDDVSINANKSFKNLIKIFERNNMHIGISSAFENLFIAQKYFTESIDALYSGIKQNSNQRIHLYDNFL